MNKIEYLPRESPFYYWSLARAVYEKDPRSFVRSQYPHLDLLKLKKLSNFVIGLFHNQQSNEWIVSFSGISDCNQSKNKRKYSVNKTDRDLAAGLIAKWSKKRPITTFVGHATGGHLASRIFIGDKNWEHLNRITWNAYDAESGSNTVNLRTKNDPNSTIKNPLKRLIKNKKYITVCDGGHDIDDFVASIQNRTWATLFSNLGIQTPSAPPQTSHSNHPVVNGSHTQALVSNLHNSHAANGPANQAASAGNANWHPIANMVGAGFLATTVGILNNNAKKMRKNAFRPLEGAVNYLAQPILISGLISAFATYSTDQYLRPRICSSSKPVPEEATAFNAKVFALEAALIGAGSKIISGSNKYAFFAALLFQLYRSVSRIFCIDDEVVKKQRIFRITELSFLEKLDLSKFFRQFFLTKNQL